MESDEVAHIKWDAQGGAKPLDPQPTAWSRNTTTVTVTTVTTTNNNTNNNNYY